MKKSFKPAPVALLTGLTAASALAPAQAQLDYRVSWIGNSFGKDDSGQWVQNDLAGLWVGADGTCYTNSRWDEGHQEGGIYKNGDVVGKLPDLHMTGSHAIAGDDDYLYLGVDKSVHNIRRYARANNRRAPWKIGGASTDTIKVGSPIQGLAVDAANRLLYVSTSVSEESAEGEIRVYNLDDTRLVRAWKMENPRRLAVAPDGSVWVATDNAVAHYSSAGALLPQRISGAGLAPAALCFDKQGRLMIADNGPDQQIKIYGDLTASAPQVVATLGAKGGIFSEKPGQVAPLKFNGLTGLGVDASGNVYVGQNRFGPRTNSYAGPGTILESYASNGSRLWRLLSLEFVSSGAFTPGSDGAEVYSNLSRYTLDLNQTKPGGEATYVGHTLNQFKYPDDERWLRRDNNYDWVTGYAVRILGGQKILFHNAMWGGRLGVSRFNAATDGEIAIPCGEVKSDQAWRDLNGDGARQPNEMTAMPATPNGKGIESYQIDAAGTLWQSFNSDGPQRPGGLRRFAFTGLDKNGSPTWDFANPTVITQPAPFSAVHRVEYVPATDTMFLAGYSGALDPANGWGQPGYDGKSIGSVLARYDRWSAGNRAATWTQVVPDYRKIPNGWAVADDFIFIGYDGLSYQPDSGHIQVRRASDGVQVGRMWAGPSNIGRIDIKHGVSAMKRSNGEYLVLSEDDWYARLMLWRWTPPAKAPAAPTLTATAGNSYALLSWTPDPNASVYELARSTDKNGPYATIARLEGTRYTDTNNGAALINGTTCFYRVRAIGAAGDSPASALQSVTPSGALPLRINSGGGPQESGWLGDTFVKGGNSISIGGIRSDGVTGAAPAAIYASVRRQGDPILYSFSGQDRNRKYTVRLHFGEWWNEIGERKINIQINGTMVATDLDVAREAGGKNRALVKEFPDISPDANGAIAVAIVKSGETMINGIEIIPTPA